MKTELDCLVIGGGPAGLSAAIYLARFHLKVAVIDAGNSRAAMIPKTRNHAGFPDGISGPLLLNRMRGQATKYGANITSAHIDRLERFDGGYVAHAGDRSWTARSVLLATGVVNNAPPIADDMHDIAVERGLLRYCPICDGYEVTEQKIGVIGTGEHGLDEAVFLRMYSPHVTMIAPDGGHDLTEDQRRKADEANISLVEGPCQPLRIADTSILVPTPQGELTFDTVYPALGSVIRSELATKLGAENSDGGCLVVDEHQRTSLAGLYAAGDVTMGLDQISHAMGEGGVAATAIRNDLAAKAPLWR